MSFLNPALLAAGLSAIAIPIIIHLLFRRRRKPIVWGAMRFLLEAYRKQRRRLTLEQLILLLLRCGVLAAVALAVGRPLLGAAAALGGGQGRDVYLLIDNSMTAKLVDESGRSALERHLEAAAAMLDSLGASDRAGLIALSAPAQAIVAPASTDIAGVRAALSRVAPTDAAADIAGGLRALASAIEAGEASGEAARGRAAIVILSDFLEGSADLARDLPPLFSGASAPTILASRPRQQSPGNTQIARVEPLRSLTLLEGSGVAAAPVRITLRRFGEAAGRAQTTSLQLRAIRLDRAAAALAEGASRTTVRWQAGETDKTVALPAPALPAAADEGFAALVAEIDRDALAADDARSATLRIRERLRVAIVGREFDARSAAGALDRLSPERWLELALAPAATSPVETTRVDAAALDEPTLASVSVAALTRPDLVDARGWSLLRGFVDEGGVLLVVPPAQAQVHMWTDALASSLGLPWVFPREATTLAQGAGLAAEQPPSALLALLAPELAALTAPVSIERALTPTLAPGQSPILTLETGQPWAVASPAGAAEAQREQFGESGAEAAGQSAELSRGLVVYLGSALSFTWTDLPARPLFVALLQEVVRQGSSLADASLSRVAGSRLAAPARAIELEPVATVGSEAREPVAVSEDGYTLEPVRSAGLFAAVDDRGRVRGGVVVAPDADAGNTRAQAPDAVRAWLAGAVDGGGNVRLLDSGAQQSLGGAISGAEASQRSSWSFPLLLAALALALLETLCARLFSHAQRSGAASAEAAS